MSKLDTDDASLLGAGGWNSAGGVPRRAAQPRRRSVIVGGDHRIASRAENVSLDGHDLIVVQTKASRVGMYLLGQALFSHLLIEDRFAPRSIRTVALCAADDAVLTPARRALRYRGGCGRPSRVTQNLRPTSRSIPLRCVCYIIPEKYPAGSSPLFALAQNAH
jgi:hypothetical protein